MFCAALVVVIVFQEQQTEEEDVPLWSVPSYACQRRTTLQNHNSAFTVSSCGSDTSSAAQIPEQLH